MRPWLRAGLLCSASLLLLGAAAISMNGCTYRVASLASPSPSSTSFRLMLGDVEQGNSLRTVDYNALQQESYDRLADNPFQVAQAEPLSTFAIDVDTASYANVRRFLREGMPVPKDAVRIEEIINYFPYNYPAPTGGQPFAVHTELTTAPWASSHHLLRIGLKGKEIREESRPNANLVFLIDTSGSMQQSNRLPLVKKALSELTNKLTAKDRVTIVTYAGSAGLALAPTEGTDKATILGALEKLHAGGSTAGGAGIELAYQQAVSNFVQGGINRVLLCTDGDFNVGITDRGALTRLIEQKARSGVYLSVLGFGMGNYKDATLEELSRRGNGNYAYIDSPSEARKVLIEQGTGTLITIAKDVKIQIEFNPAKVNAYRLIGYENRLLANRDFNDDQKDAGEIGASHTVTALYEIIPTGVLIPQLPNIDPLKYQQPALTTGNSPDLATLKLRYKEPEGDNVSKLIQVTLSATPTPFSQASEDTRFTAALAQFGMLLRDSPYKGSSTYASVLATAKEAVGFDPNQYRRDFLELLSKSQDKLSSVEPH